MGMKKRTKITVISLAVVIVLIVGGFYIYVSDYYRADETALAVKQGGNLSVVGNLTVLSPSQPSDTALIFYPGGKVEHTAYLPLLDALRQNNITCILVEMPFNLAVFNADAADGVYEKFPEIDNWFIGGHSLGGAMASSYFGKNLQKAQGLILLGAYIYGDADPNRTLIVYGTEDVQLDVSQINPDAGPVWVIQGGNHAQFGNYGAQHGDGTAKISAKEQQDIAVNEILGFINQRVNRD